MSEYKVKWLPQAFSDLDRIQRFFSEISLDIALKSVSIIYESIDLLQTMPKMGNQLTGDLREFRDLIVSFGKGSFIIRYRIENNIIFITYIWHSKENRPR